MGVKDFFRVVISNKESEWHGYTIEDLGVPVSLEDIATPPERPDGTLVDGPVRVAIDASLVIWQSSLGTVKIDTLTDKDGNPTVHIATVFNKIIQLKQAGLEQIWVFDSPEPNEMKKLAYANRAQSRANAIAANRAKGGFKLTSAIIAEIKALLSAMGCTYIQAPSGVEAEQYAARLTMGPKHTRFCQYVLSGDSDVLMFGGNLLRAKKVLSETGKTSKTQYYAYDLDYILEETGMTRTQLIRMGVALGNDFNSRIERCGPRTVMAAIKSKKQKVFLSSEQQQVYAYYASDIKDKMQQGDIVTSEYDRDAVVAFLTSKNFDPKRIDVRLNAYEKAGASS